MSLIFKKFFVLVCVCVIVVSVFRDNDFVICYGLTLLCLYFLSSNVLSFFSSKLAEKNNKESKKFENKMALQIVELKNQVTNINNKMFGENL